MSILAILLTLTLWHGGGMEGGHPASIYSPSQLVTRPCNPTPDSVTNFRVAFWNVENFYDVYRDTVSDDSDFTPQGPRHWTRRRFEEKRSHIYKTVAAMDFPDVIGLAEVENASVLRELCLGTPLRSMGYRYVHYDSPDRRGIDNALLYRPDRFTPFTSRPVGVSDTAVIERGSTHPHKEAFRSRDILLVGGVAVGGDTLFILVNHFPSQLGGAEADSRRAVVAARLRSLMDSLRMAYPSAGIIVVGDFNAEPSDPVIRGIFAHDSLFLNLMARVVPTCESGSSVSTNAWGSYKYHGYWSFIDQIFVSVNLLPRVANGTAHVFNAPFLLCEDKTYMGQRPYRTWHGPSYKGGFSDHLPIYIDLR